MLRQSRNEVHFVSSQGTDTTEKEGAMWARVKGRTENALVRLPFPFLYDSPRLHSAPGRHSIEDAAVSDDLSGLGTDSAAVVSCHAGPRPHNPPDRPGNAHRRKPWLRHGQPQIGISRMAAADLGWPPPTARRPSFQARGRVGFHGGPAWRLEYSYPAAAKRSSSSSKSLACRRCLRLRAKSTRPSA